MTITRMKERRYSPRLSELTSATPQEQKTWHHKQRIPQSVSYWWWKKSCTRWYGKYSIYLQGFIHVRWSKISSINNIMSKVITKNKSNFHAFRPVMNVLHSLLTKPCNLKSNLRCKSQKNEKMWTPTSTFGQLLLSFLHHSTNHQTSRPFKGHLCSLWRCQTHASVENECWKPKWSSTPLRGSTSSPPPEPRQTPDIPGNPTGFCWFFLFVAKSRIMDCFIFRRRWISPESQRWQCLQSAPWFQKIFRFPWIRCEM